MTCNAWLATSKSASLNEMEGAWSGAVAGLIGGSLVTAIYGHLHGFVTWWIRNARMKRQLVFRFIRLERVTIYLVREYFEILSSANALRPVVAMDHFKTVRKNVQSKYLFGDPETQLLALRRFVNAYSSAAPSQAADAEELIDFLLALKSYNDEAERLLKNGNGYSLTLLNLLVLSGVEVGILRILKYLVGQGWGFSSMPRARSYVSQYMLRISPMAFYRNQSISLAEPVRQGQFSSSYVLGLWAELISRGDLHAGRLSEGAYENEVLQIGRQRLSECASSMSSKVSHLFQAAKI